MIHGNVRKTHPSPRLALRRLSDEATGVSGHPRQLAITNIPIAVISTDALQSADREAYFGLIFFFLGDGDLDR
jgi:hypothetical protein